jgi:hypothetical protein
MTILSSVTESMDSSDVLHIAPLAQSTIRHCQKTSAHLCIFPQPDIAAVLTSNDCIAFKVRVAFRTNIDDDFSVACADLKRHESIVAVGVAMTESTDKTNHHT